MRKPLITIGLTSYNAASTIQRAIYSAQSQTWKNTEILIVDDGSTDGSREILQDIVKNSPCIRLVLHGQNQGTAISRNKILKEAKGNYIAFFDDDDVSHPDRIRKQYERIESYRQATDADIIFCYADRAVIPADESTPKGYYPAIGKPGKEAKGVEVADNLLWHYETPDYSWGHVGTCAMMFHRDVVKKIGFFDDRFRRCAEWDWSVRAAFKGAHFIGVDSPLVTQYITKTADKAGKKPLRYALLLREKHKDYLKKYNLYLASKAIAHSRFSYARGRPWRSRFWLAFACLLSPFKILPNELKKRKRRKRHD